MASISNAFRRFFFSRCLSRMVRQLESGLLDAFLESLVFDIVRGGQMDGPGLRTTVFLKGCPLRCVWCHNPEGQDFTAEISFQADRCARCRTCQEACPNRAINFESEEFIIRERCEVCGACADSCDYLALRKVGVIYEYEELVDGVTVLPRVPLVPGVNSMKGNLAGIAKLLLSHKATSCELLTFNPSGAAKWKRLGKRAPEKLRDKPIPMEDEAEIQEFFHHLMQGKSELLFKEG